MQLAAVANPVALHPRSDPSLAPSLVIQISKGTKLTFSTGKDGSLTTLAGGKHVGHIAAPLLSHVLFGLYLGRQPLQQDIQQAFGMGLAASVLHV